MQPISRSLSIDPATQPHSIAITFLEPRPYDFWHIDLHERFDIDFWMKHLDCDEGALRTAVYEVGARVTDVRNYLAFGKPQELNA